MGLIDGTVHHPDPHGRAAALNGGQRPFRLQHAADSVRVYALGAELQDAALLLAPDPYTGYPRFHAFVSAGEALLWLQRELGTATPVILVWDERPLETDIPFVEDDVELVKPRASWRPLTPQCPALPNPSGEPSCLLT
jgi:hypothetical protein